MIAGVIYYSGAECATSCKFFFFLFAGKKTTPKRSKWVFGIIVKVSGFFFVSSRTQKGKLVDKKKFLNCLFKKIIFKERSFEWNDLMDWFGDGGFANKSTATPDERERERGGERERERREGGRKKRGTRQQRKYIQANITPQNNTKNKHKRKEPKDPDSDWLIQMCPTVTSPFFTVTSISSYLSWNKLDISKTYVFFVFTTLFQ